MKLHLPCGLRKALLVAMASVATLSTTVQADNNVIINHGEVDAGISIGKKKSDSAYGWASGLNFSADSDNACFLGVSTDFTNFDTSVFSLPDLPTMPDSLLPPNPAALAQFALQMIDYAVKLAKMIGETVEVGVLVSDIAGANATDAVYGKNTYMGYDSGKVYNSIISEAYDSDRAGFETEVGSDIYMATGPAGVPIPIPATGMSKGHQDKNAEGYINVDGALVKFSNEVRADSYLTIAGNGRVISVDGPGTVSIKGNIDVKEGSTLSSQNIHSDDTITITTNSIVAAETISAKNGINLNGSTLAGVNNSITGSSNLTVESDLAADGSNILSNFGSIDLKNLTGSGNKVVARNDISITEGITGDTNILNADKLIEIGKGITGNNNVLNTNGGQIHLGANGNGNSIEGNGNQLGTGSQKTEDIALDGKIKGDNNLLKATDTITTGAIEGNGNQLTVTGSHATNETVITLNGGITGDGNKLETLYGGSITVNGDVSNALTGGTAGNKIIVNGNGNISVTGQVSGTNEFIQTNGSGNIQLGSLGDNYGLNLVAKDGSISITGSSNATITNGTSGGSLISASGDITLGSSLAAPDTNATLVIAGGSKMTSVNGNIIANQNLAATGINSVISASKGEITVYGTLTATEKALVTAGKVNTVNLVVTNGGTVTATGAGREIVLDNGELLIQDATVNGNISGVDVGLVSGGTANTIVTGTITGTGAGSGLTVEGLAQIGTPAIDGSITNFENIVLGNIADSMVSNITINGDVKTSENGTIGVAHGDKVVITDEMTAGSSITIVDSNLTVGGARDEIKYKDTGYLGTHEWESTTDHSDMEAGTSISIGGNSTVNVFDNMTAGTDIAIGGGSNVTVGSADQILNQYVFNYEINAGEVPAVVATIIAGSSVTGYLLPSLPLVLKDTLTHSDMTAGGKITIAEGSTVKVVDNMTAKGGDITVSNSQLTVGTIGDKTYVAKDDSSITVYEKHGDMTAQNNIFLDKATVSVFEDQIAVTGGIQITDSKLGTAFNGNVPGQSASVVIGRDQIAGTFITVDGSTLIVGRDQTAKNGNIVINESTVTIGSAAQPGNQTALAGSIGVTDSTLDVFGNQWARDHVELTGSTVTVTGSQTASTGHILIDSSTVTVGTEDVFADQTAYTDIVIKNASEVTINGNQIAQTGSIGVADSTLDISGSQTAHKDISIERSEVVVIGSQTAETGSIFIDDDSHVDIGTEEENADQTAYENIVINDNSLVHIFGNQTAQHGFIQIFENSSLTLSGHQSAASYIHIKDSEATIDGNQTAGTVIGIDGSIVSVGGNQTAQNGHVAINNSEVTVGDSMTAKSADGVTLANIIITDSDVLVGTEGLTGEDHNDMTADNSIGIADSTVKIVDDMTARDGDIVLSDNIVPVDGSEFAVVVGDSMIAMGDKDADKGSIQINNTTLEVGRLNHAEGHGNMMADNWISVDGESIVKIYGNQWAGTHIIVDGTSDLTIDGDQTADTDYIGVSGESTVTVGGDQTAHTFIKVDEGSTITVSGDQTAQTGVIDIDDISTVTVSGDQTAFGNIQIQGESIVKVDGHQTSQDGSIFIDEASHVDVGTLLLKSDQTAKKDIVIDNGSIVTISRNQIAQTGSILLDHESELNVGGNQTAYKDIQIEAKSTAIIKGGQTAETGQIVMDDSHVEVGTLDMNGDQFAKTLISITSDSSVLVNGNQIADTSFINVVGSSLEVTGNETAGSFINIDDSTVEIGGNQTARNGNVQISKDSIVTVGDSMFALSGDGTTQADIIITDSKVAVGTVALTGEDHNDMMADNSIKVQNSTVSVLDDMAAHFGNILLKQNTGKSDGYDTAIFVGDSMIARGDKTVTDPDHLSGSIQISNTTVEVGSLNHVTGHGNMMADNFIDIRDASAVKVWGNQQAGTYIQVLGKRDEHDVVTKTTLDVLGSQTALAGGILIKDADVNVGTEGIGGSQTAHTDIGIQNAEVTVAGSQTAETGNIVISDLSTVTVGSETVKGDQFAGVSISIKDSTNTVYGDQTAKLGSIYAENSTLELSGNQTAGIGIVLKDTDATIAGSQTAQDGGIGINTGSRVIVGDNMSALSGKSKAEANIVIDGSLVTVGDEDLAGEAHNSMMADNTIQITNSTVGVLNDMIARNGDIILKNNNAADSFEGGKFGGTDFAIVVGDSMIARKGKKDTGRISIENTTFSVGSQNSEAGHGDMIADSSISIIGSTGEIAGNQTSGDRIIIMDSTVGIAGNMTAQTAYDATDADHKVSIFIGDASTVDIAGNMTAADGGRIAVAGGSHTTVGGKLVADKGSLILTGDQTRVDINTDNIPSFGSVIGSGISLVYLADNTSLNTGTVSLDKSDLTVMGSITATEWAIGAGTHVIDGRGDNDGLLQVTRGDLVLKGNNSVVNDDAALTLHSMAGNIALVGNNVIESSTVKASIGDIVIKSDSSFLDSGKTASTLIKDSDIIAKDTVSIMGLDKMQALVTGASSIIATGKEDYALTTGEVVQKGILLDNTALVDLTKEQDVVALAGDIVIANRVDVKNATLSTDSRTGGQSSVVMDGKSTLRMHQGSVLESALSSADTTALVVKDGGDTLALNYCAKSYNGTIEVLAGDGSEILINTDGVGHQAITKLKDTNFIVTAKSFSDAQDGIVTIGSLDSRYDSGNRNTTAGHLADALPNGSYTLDNGDRAGFRNVGSFISFNKGNVGDVVMAKDISMNSNTLLRMEGSHGEDGTISFDRIDMDGTLDANGARIFGTLLSGRENEAAIADQARVQVVRFLNPGNGVKSAFSEDMLYDVALDPATGTYQRVHRTINAWVETREDGVYLAYSKNHISADKNYNQEQTSRVLEGLAGKVNHTEGTLAASSSKLDHLLDALDYTRSEKDALQALDNISASCGNVAQFSMMDGNRHHMDNLRSYINMPGCKDTANAGNRVQLESGSSVWMSYNGGYDSNNGDQNMGDYTRTSQGTMLGYEYALACNFLMGIDFGYENSIARSDASRFDSNTYFVDLYGSARTDIINHRFSVGVGVYDFSSERSIFVNAGSHSFNEQATGDTVGRSLNVGYEASTEFAIDSTSRAIPFLTANFSYNNLNNLKEKDLGGAGLVTDFDDLTQIEVGLGGRYEKQFTIVQNQAPALFFASAALRAQLGDRENKVVNRFVGDSEIDFHSRSLERSLLYVQLGTGVIVPVAKDWATNLSVQGEVAGEQSGVNANIGVSHSF